jgi:hypothetical protein
MEVFPSLSVRFTSIREAGAGEELRGLMPRPCC